MLTEAFELAQAAASFIRARAPEPPSLALILGSGLGDFADQLQDAQHIPYVGIPSFLPTSVQGHSGTLVLGRLGGVQVAALQGRLHGYEGHTPAQVVAPLRALQALGARTLVVTNAAGGIHPDFSPGDLMVIRDHLNLSGNTPLRGPNDERMGPRFPDMSAAYDPKLAQRCNEVAQRLGQVLQQGVYAGLSGPSYETPAEVRMLRTLGADAVGMSTVWEVLAARHLGMRVLGISCITNLAAGVGDTPLDHDAVQAVAQQAHERFGELLAGVIPELEKA